MRLFSFRGEEKVSDYKKRSRIPEFFIVAGADRFKRPRFRGELGQVKKSFFKIL